MCRKLLGDPLKKRQPGVNPGGRAYYDLLAPLQPGEAPRHADDPKKTRLYNPRWDSPPSNAVNEAYINAVTDLLCQNGGALYGSFFAHSPGCQVEAYQVPGMAEMSRTQVKLAVTKYFESMRTQWQARKSQTARLKKEAKQKRDRRNQCKHRVSVSWITEHGIYFSLRRSNATSCDVQWRHYGSCMAQRTVEASKPSCTLTG